MLKYVFFPMLVVPVLAALLFTPTAPAVAAEEAPTIGTVLSIEGKATIQLEGGSATAAAVNAPVHMNDILQTGAKSRMFILFIDNTQFTLAENTKLTVTRYVFDPDNTVNNKASYSILNGAFQYLSGLIAKKPNPDVNIGTPYGAIGIRGTKLWGGNIGGGYGVHVSEGKIHFSNGHGGVNVDAGKGTKIPNHDSPPGPQGPWTADELALILASIGDGNGVQGLIDGQQGKNKQLQEKFREWLKHHGHDKSGNSDDGKKDENHCRDKSRKNCEDDGDLPMDDVGGTDVFTPGIETGGSFGGGGRDD